MRTIAWSQVLCPLLCASVRRDSVPDAKEAEGDEVSPVVLHEDASLGIVESIGREETYSQTPEEESGPAE